MKRPREARARVRHIADELEAHVRMAIRERIDQGEEPEEARLAAEREIGDRRGLEAAIRSVWDESPSERFFSGLFRLRNTGIVIAVAAGLIASATAGDQRLSSSVLSLLAEATAGLSSDQISIAVLALACLIVLVLVTFCANLANLTQDRHRDEILKRSVCRRRRVCRWCSTGDMVS